MRSILSLILFYISISLYSQGVPLYELENAPNGALNEEWIIVGKSNSNWRARLAYNFIVDSLGVGGGGGGAIGGSGLNTYIPKFTSSSNLTYSNMYDDGSTIAATSRNVKLWGNNNQGTILDVNGYERLGVMNYSGYYPVISMASGAGLRIGSTSGASVIGSGGSFDPVVEFRSTGLDLFKRIGFYNTNLAIGVNSENYGLNQNIIGTYNINLGFLANNSNASGNDNVMIGNEAGQSNVSGSGNVYIGKYAGYYNTNLSNRLVIGCGTCGTQLIEGNMNAGSMALDVNGKLKYTIESVANASALTGVGSDGYLKKITIGSGLNLTTAGVLNGTSGINGNGINGRVSLWNSATNIGTDALAWDYSSNKLGIGYVDTTTLNNDITGVSGLGITGTSSALSMRSSSTWSQFIADDTRFGLWTNAGGGSDKFKIIYNTGQPNFKFLEGTGTRIVASNAAGDLTNILNGSANQILAMNAGANGYTWVNPPSAGTTYTGANGVSVVGSTISAVVTGNGLSAGANPTGLSLTNALQTTSSSGVGILVKTGSGATGTVVPRTLVQGTGISISNANGSSGDITISATGGGGTYTAGRGLFNASNTFSTFDHEFGQLYVNGSINQSLTTTYSNINFSNFLHTGSTGPAANGTVTANSATDDITLGTLPSNQFFEVTMSGAVNVATSGIASVAMYIGSSIQQQTEITINTTAGETINYSRTFRIVLSQGQVISCKIKHSTPATSVISTPFILIRKVYQ
jgi:hypothetical protein